MNPLTKLGFIYRRIEPCSVDIDIHQSFVQYTFGINEEQKKESFNRMLEMLKNQQAMVEAALSIESERDKLQALKSMAKATSQWRMFTGMEKLKGTAEAVYNVFEYSKLDKVVVFCSQVDFVTQLQSLLKPYHPIVLFVGTPHEKRRSHLRRFKMNAHNKVLISVVQAMQFPTDITAAAKIFFAEPSWNPQENAQAVMRCHNMHQSREVSVSWVTVPNSVEAKVTQLLQKATQGLVKAPDEFEFHGPS